MAEQLPIKGIIELILKGTGGKEAQQQVEALSKQLGITKTQLEGTIGAARQLVAVFGVGFGLDKIAAFIRDSVTEFAREERAVNALRSQLQSLGIDAARAIESLRAIESAGGPSVDETAASFAKFAGITRDLNAALSLTRLAMDLATERMTSVEAEASVLGSVLQGRAGLAAKDLGVQLVDTSGKARDAGDILEQAAQQHAGFAERVRDTQQSLTELSRAWKEFKEAAGSIFGPLLSVPLNAVAVSLRAIVSGFDSAKKVAVDFANVLAVAMDFGKLFRQGPTAYIEAIKAQLGKGIGDALVAGFNAADPLAADQARKAGLESGTKFAEGIATAAEQARAKERDQRRKQEEELARETIKAQIQASAAGSAERLRLQEQLLASERKAAEDEAKATGGNLEEIGRQFATRELALTLEHARERARVEQEFALEAMRAEVSIAEEGTQERLDAELRYLDARREAALRGYEQDAELRKSIEANFETERNALLERSAQQQRERSDRLARETAEARADAIRSEIGLMEEGSRERLAAEEELLREETAARIVAAGDNTEAIKAIELAAALELAQKRIEFEKAALARELELRRAAADAATDAIAAGLEEQIAILESVQGTILQVMGIRKAMADAEAEAAIESEQAAYDEEAAKVQAVHDGALARIAIREAERRAEIEGGEGTPEEKAAQLLDLEQATAEARLEIEANYQRESARIQQTYSDRISAVLSRHAAAGVKIEKDAADAKKQQWQAIAIESVNFLTAAFGQNKAVAVAQAIVDTWLAVQNALAFGGPPPGNMILAGITAAIGAANVQKILSTNIGSTSVSGGAAGAGAGTPPASGTAVRETANLPGAGSVKATGGLPSLTERFGFDNPMHDALARQWGHQQAEDLTRYVGLGYIERMAELTRAPAPVIVREISEEAGRSIAPAPAAVAAPAGAVNVTLRGFMGRQDIRRLVRELERAQVREQSRRVL